ncbi:protein of unknown function [Shinella sp. WSC3-e]|nr:hypothetical protein SHINE37_41432 [Rhizobiaceae bacterium]CAK7256060.1 protein of unknown function [Shinella sp. WSC3-e]
MEKQKDPVQPGLSVCGGYLPNLSTVMVGSIRLSASVRRSVDPRLKAEDDVGGRGEVSRYY